MIDNVSAIRDLVCKIVLSATASGDMILNSMHHSANGNLGSFDLSFTPFLTGNAEISPEFKKVIFSAANDILLSKGQTFNEVDEDAEMKSEDDIRCVIYGWNYSYYVPIVALIYFDKAVISNPSLFLRSENVGLVLATAYILAQEWLKGPSVSIGDVAECLEIPLPDLGKMKTTMMEALGHNMWVSDETMNATEENLPMYMRFQEGDK